MYVGITSTYTCVHQNARERERERKREKEREREGGRERKMVYPANMSDISRSISRTFHMILDCFPLTIAKREGPRHSAVFNIFGDLIHNSPVLWSRHSPLVRLFLCFFCVDISRSPRFDSICETRSQIEAVTARVAFLQVAAAKRSSQERSSVRA